jgi:hypothetical protein
VSCYTALLDANILYSAPMRDLFLQLAVTDLFRARWTDDIHREWMEAVIKNRPGIDRARLERIRRLMDEKTGDSIISGYEDLVPSLHLPDPDDRHVLAAAIVGRCDVIVTQNLKDFPNASLAAFQIEAQHPDEFLCNQMSLAPGLFCSSVRKVRQRLNNPPYDIESYLGILGQQGLVATAAELQSFAELL